MDVDLGPTKQKFCVKSFDTFWQQVFSVDIGSSDVKNCAYLFGAYIDDLLPFVKANMSQNRMSPSMKLILLMEVFIHRPRYAYTNRSFCVGIFPLLNPFFSCSVLVYDSEPSILL